MSFQIDIARLDPATVVVTLRGRLDSSTAPQMAQHLQSLFDPPNSVLLLDLHGLEYISSAGLRVVLMAAKQSAQLQRRLTLYGMQDHVREVFAISGFLKILDVRPDRAQALQAS